MRSASEWKASVSVTARWICHLLTVIILHPEIRERVGTARGEAGCEGLGTETAGCLSRFRVRGAGVLRPSSSVRSGSHIPCAVSQTVYMGCPRNHPDDKSASPRDPGTPIPAFPWSEGAYEGINAYYGLVTHVRVFKTAGRPAEEKELVHPRVSRFS